jgi:cytochrome c
MTPNPYNKPELQRFNQYMRGPMKQLLIITGILIFVSFLSSCVGLPQEEDEDSQETQTVVTPSDDNSPSTIDNNNNTDSENSSQNPPNTNQNEQPQNSEPPDNNQSTNSPNDQTSPPSGESIYSQPVSAKSPFSCSTCHAITEPAPDGIRRVGHPLADATKRLHYKDGETTSMLTAVNSCLTEWMNTTPWTEDTPEWEELYTWLDVQSTSTETQPIDIEIVPPLENLSGGNATSGQTLFNASCSICHEIDGTGGALAPKVGGRGYDEFFTAELVAKRVRTSGSSTDSIYTGLTGGVMPFWGKNRLSDDELKDLIAFLEIKGELTEPGPEPEPEPSLPDDNSNTNNPPTTGTTCASTHPKIGQTAELSTFAHRVSGTAEIVDDCTVVINNFNFDGQGIVVEVYGGIDGNYKNGFPISDNIFGQPYTNGTLEIKLPETVTLDDFNGISIWCTAVGVSFGDGLFQSP